MDNQKRIQANSRKFYDIYIDVKRVNNGISKKKIEKVWIPRLEYYCSAYTRSLDILK